MGPPFSVDKPLLGASIVRLPKKVNQEVQGFDVEITGQTMDNRAAVEALTGRSAPFHVINRFAVVVAQLVRAPACGAGGWGFESPQPPHIFVYRCYFGSLAQLAEQGTLNPKVTGSIPV